MTVLRTNRGFTLIELIVAIIVIGIGLSGVLMVMNLTTARSADPMVPRQATALAEAYLEEILLRAYDEDAVPGTADSEGTWGPDAGESGRALFDDVNDYILPPHAPQDQNGNPLAALSAYTVEVEVQNTPLNGIAAARVAVRVKHPNGTDITLTGYRTAY